MPPALSDYSSFYESDQNESPPRKTLSRKRKRGGLLSGIDEGNIIMIPSDEMIISTAEDSVPTSSAAPSSYTTRGSARGASSNGNLAYDQKYHPMDEYLRPSQASKRRAEHGLDNEDSSSDESNVDAGEQPQMKKRKLGKFPRRQGTRRSSRRTNRDVLYNMEIHPQDLQLQQMAADSVVNEAVEQNDEVVSIGSSAATEEEDDRVVCDTTDDASDLTASSPPRSTPLPAISIDNEGQQSTTSNDVHIDQQINRSLASPSMEQTPFDMLEESLHSQLIRETTSPVPIENEQNEESVHYRETSPNLVEQYLLPAMFDGPSDRLGVARHHHCHPRMHAQVDKFDLDSVLGSDIDSATGEQPGSVIS